MRRFDRNPRLQHGVAVVTALLLTTLAVTIVASLFWQQQLQVRSIENQRLQLQKQWVLRGALDWARLILREDGRNSTIDELNEPWAIPLAPTRLDQYVESATTSGDAGSAVLSGSIQDAQGRFNLTNLINLSDLAKQEGINQSALEAFARLLTSLRQDPALAKVIAQYMVAAARAASNSQADAVRPISFVQLDDLLAVPGYTPPMVNAIRSYTVILPAATPVNINTASPEVLAARVPGLSLADASTVANSRRQTAFQAVADLAKRLPDQAKSLDDGSLSVASNYFLVNGSVTIRSAKLEIEALVERQPAATRLLWVREL
jgi:general secretion pathway protein K